MVRSPLCGTGDFHLTAQGITLAVLLSGAFTASLLADVSRRHCDVGKMLRQD